jgi:hypothetical protein
VGKARKEKGRWFLFAPNAFFACSHHLLFRPANSVQSIQTAFYTILQHLEPFMDNGIAFMFLLSQAVYYMGHIPNRVVPSRTIIPPPSAVEIFDIPNGAKPLSSQVNK